MLFNVIRIFHRYGEYPELCGQLHKYIKPRDDVLMLGCGNSKLSMDLYDVGCRYILIAKIFCKRIFYYIHFFGRQITNIDISQLVINQMIETNKKERADMKYLQMDATAMSFANDQFSVALDKGTLDALMTDDTAEVHETVQKYLSEISRVLR